MAHTAGQFHNADLYGGFPYYSDSRITARAATAPDHRDSTTRSGVTAQQGAPAAQEATRPRIPHLLRPLYPKWANLILVRRDGRFCLFSVFRNWHSSCSTSRRRGSAHAAVGRTGYAATQDMNEARGTTLQFHTDIPTSLFCLAPHPDRIGAFSAKVEASPGPPKRWRLRIFPRIYFED